MKIAWFTPFGVSSAIGSYSQEIVESLVLRDEVTLFVSNDDIAGLDVRKTTVPIVGFDEASLSLTCDRIRDFDIVVYNMGDYFQYHVLPFLTKASVPGIVVLHDVVMRDFYRGYCDLYLNEYKLFQQFQEFAHGDDGNALWAEECSGRFRDCPEDARRLDLPMFLPALDNATGIVVHSEYARARVARAVSVPVRHIDFPRAPGWESIVPRTRDPLARVEVLTYGVLNKNKQVHEIIRVIGEDSILRASIRYRLIGSGEPLYVRQLRDLIHRYELQNAVELMGWQPDSALDRAIARADIIVNLRNPHCGESSWSLLISLLAGVPTIVWNHGFYAEFPDDVVCKVSSDVELHETLSRLTAAPALRTQIGARARAHATERFATPRYCDELRSFIGEVQAQEPVWNLADRVADFLAEMGTSPGLDNVAGRVSTEIAGFLGDRPEAVLG